MMELLPIARKYGPWLVGILIVGFVVSNWVSANADKARMEATLEAQAHIIKGYEQHIKDLDGRMEAREEETRQRIEAYEQVIRRVQTPKEIIREIPTYVPNLPKPVETITTPEGKTGAFIPDEDLKPLFDRLVRAEAQAVELAAAKQTIADLQEKVTVLEQKVVSIETQRDAAVKAAKGGSIWRRVGRAGKWLDVGIVAGLTLGRL